MQRPALRTTHLQQALSYANKQPRYMDSPKYLNNTMGCKIHLKINWQNQNGHVEFTKMCVSGGHQYKTVSIPGLHTLVHPNKRVNHMCGY